MKTLEHNCVYTITETTVYTITENFITGLRNMQT